MGMLGRAILAILPQLQHIHNQIKYLNKQEGAAEVRELIDEGNQPQIVNSVFNLRLPELPNEQTLTIELVNKLVNLGVDAKFFKEKADNNKSLSDNNPALYQYVNSPSFGNSQAMNLKAVGTFAEKPSPDGDFDSDSKLGNASPNVTTQKH